MDHIAIIPHAILYPLTGLDISEDVSEGPLV